MVGDWQNATVFADSRNRQVKAYAHRGENIVSLPLRHQKPHTTASETAHFRLAEGTLAIGIRKNIYKILG